MDEPNSVQPDGQVSDNMARYDTPPKKKGWPKGKPRPKRNLPPPSQPGDTPQPKEKKPRPLCEKGELAKYPPDGIMVVWGVQPKCERFKRKGLAVLFNPKNKGGQVTLMPVTDDGDEGLRWRYRWANGPAPYRYEKIDLEPGEAATTPNILRAVADTIESGINKFYGGVREADQTTIDYIKERIGDALGDKIRKEGIF